MASDLNFPELKELIYIYQAVNYISLISSMYTRAHLMLSMIFALTPANQHHDASPKDVEPCSLLAY